MESFNVSYICKFLNMTQKSQMTKYSIFWTWSPIFPCDAKAEALGRTHIGPSYVNLGPEKRNLH